MSKQTERQEPDPVDDVDRWIQEHTPPLDDFLDLEAGLKDVYRRAEALQATDRADRD